MKLAELLADQPPVRRIAGARLEIRKALIDSGKRLVVIDDDPTGMQAVQDVSVFLDWSVDTLRRALGAPQPVFFVSVNSRSLGPAEAESLGYEVGGNLRLAAQSAGVEVLLASRSDSTLRGHFPYEVSALTDGFGLKADGIILAPAFFEAGRYTVDDMQWAELDGGLVPVHETEFARDPVFSFHNSNLKDWVAEKSRGAVTPESVLSISLRLIREEGPAAVTRELLRASGAVPIVVNGAAYEDLEVFCLGLRAAEEQGKRFVYRCSASFLKARGGFPDRPLLTRQEMVTGGGPGLIVAGSYVGKTSRQLRRLLDSGLASGFELRVDRLQSREDVEDEIRRVSQGVERSLLAGVTTVLYTSRTLFAPPGRDFPQIGRSVMRALCETVRRVHVRPAYVVAKGGVTSIETAKTALDVKEAFALGQILPGVPVWRLGAESRWPGIACVVFPGNVGDDSALLSAVTTLSGG